MNVEFIISTIHKHHFLFFSKNSSFKNDLFDPFDRIDPKHNNPLFILTYVIVIFKIKPFKSFQTISVEFNYVD
jgi:hypothetical protein